MMFSRESGLVKVWVELVIIGVYKVEQVPQLFNLKEVVSEVVNSYKE